jgi:hypothetical protein
LDGNIVLFYAAISNWESDLFCPEELISRMRYSNLAKVLLLEGWVRKGKGIHFDIRWLLEGKGNNGEVKYEPCVPSIS